MTSADLVYDDTRDRFVLHVRTKTTINGESAPAGTEDPTPIVDSDDVTDETRATMTDAGHRTVLGVDCGIEHLAVTSTGRFWNGAELQH